MNYSTTQLMKDRFLTYILEYHLFNQKDKLIVGISGGADSITLAHLLINSGNTVEFAHCNFKLRGDDADADALFVQKLAERNNVKCHIKCFDTNTYAKQHKISIQMAARDLRYAWFETLRIERNAKYIAIAHHLNDDVETFFINLIRGTGIKGLLGINKSRNKIVRPLLFAKRKEIDNYIIEHQLKFREDQSNESTKYLRNKIRHQLLPLIKEMNPNITETIAKESNTLSGVFQIYHQEMEKIRENLLIEKENYYKIELDALRTLNPIQPYLYELLKPFGFSTITDIVTTLGEQSGQQFFSNTHRIVIDRKYMLISLLNDSTVVRSVAINMNDKEIQIPIHMAFYIQDIGSINKMQDTAQLDYDKLIFPLSLRRWEKGDKFIPLGMQSFKKLSDFFIDQKFSLIQKEQVWILCSEENVVWIVGHRIDERYKVSTQTKKMYIAHLLEQK